MAIIALPWSFYRAHRRLYDKSQQNRLKMRYANNYDKSKHNTIKTRYANKHSFHYVRRTPASWTPACLYAGPAVPKLHGFNFENKHTTDEDFVLLCKRTSSARRQRSANAVKAQCMYCERRESAVKASLDRRESPTRTRRNVIERHASSVATPWSLSGRRDRPFFTKKYQGFHAISRRSGKLNNSVPTQWKRGLV